MDKMSIEQTAAITLFIMLILPLPVKIHACCNETVTYQSSPLIEAAKHLRQWQLQAESSSTAASTQIEPPHGTLIHQTADNRTALISPVTDPQQNIGLTGSETTTDKTAQKADATTLELELLTPASTEGKEETASNEEFTTNIAASVSTITETGFVKIASTGEMLDDEVEQWACVADKSNKLVWEVKTDDGGLRDRDSSYSWLRSINGDANGTSDGGRCNGGVNCDTLSYVRAVNEQKLCSYSDWRLPSREELETLVEHHGHPEETTINRAYFPQAIPSWYWTATEYPQAEGFAWYVLFKNGIALNDLKERPKHIRLVRGPVQR